MDPSQQHAIELCSCPNYFENCSQCLVVSLDGNGHSDSCRSINTKSEFRADIYGKMPMPIFKMRIENPHDVLHVLNKTSGMFEVFVVIIVIIV